MATEAPKIRLGWEDWLGLPDLGLPDLGQRTGPRSTPEPRPARCMPLTLWSWGPLTPCRCSSTSPRSPTRPTVVVRCTAPVIDRREVTSSNGTSEWRYVILTRIDVGGASWPIEITLTDRAGMTSRMVLGCQP